MISSIDDLEIGNAKLIAGVDEVGRGPLAGPVIASAVILDPKKKIDNLCDSKKLSSKMRFLISKNIKMNCIEWSIGRAEVNEIDELNILQASLLAMKRAVDKLKVKPELVVVDGQYTPNIDIKKIDQEIILDVKVFDNYQNKDLRAIALEVILQSKKGTLTENEINELSEKIITQAKTKFNARLR